MNATNTEHDLKVMIDRVEKIDGLYVERYEPGDTRLYFLSTHKGRPLSDTLPAREFLAFLNGFEAGSWQHEPV